MLTTNVGSPVVNAINVVPMKISLTPSFLARLIDIVTKDFPEKNKIRRQNNIPIKTGIAVVMFYFLL